MSNGNAFGPFRTSGRTSGGIRLAPIILGLVAVGAFLIKSCQTGPFGRQQLVAVNPAQEAQLGSQAFQQVLAEERGNVLPADVPISQAVQRIARRLAAVANDPQILAATKLQQQSFDWQARVVRSDTVNAFCLPGGKIVVYTGIVPVAQTSGGLAVVMGHEIAHALAHHGAERMAQNQIVQIGASSVAGSLGDMPPNQQRAVMAMFGMGAKFGLLKYSRSHESEADHIGLLLMAAAGYDPREATSFWARMGQVSKGAAPPEYLSTHPSHQTRIADLKRWTPEALPLYERSNHAPEDQQALPGVR
ncbi:MAG: M48 family metallopeptidase [Gemmataceae bacterium]